MLFNSWSFAIFLPVVFFAYYFLAGNRTKTQNLILLIASYFFYGSWDWRFLGLLLFSTLLDYASGIQIDRSTDPAKRKAWLVASIVINLGLLGVFKYYNFFVENINTAFQSAGLSTNFTALHLILPIGISFYTFHGLSYVFDIYRSKIKPEKDFITYSLFVSYFPLLVAGPIERATHLLPQLKNKRTFSLTLASDGFRQILYGLFKKMVIADTCAEYANMVFNNYHSFSSITLVLGAVFFAFQIYGDFSGYSDIAIGTSKLFGIELIRNFSFPYFSRNISEFWRRWHISLSSWFKDYLYIPLGGSKGSTFQKVRNVLIIFLVSGFWHGANWTFIIWGLLNALFILPQVLKGNNRKYMAIVAANSYLPTMRDFFLMVLTFALTCFAWIFFRSPNIADAFGYVSGIFSFDLDLSKTSYNKIYLLFIVFFILVEWAGRKKEYALQLIGDIKNPAIVYIAEVMVIMIILIFCTANTSQFIYFQF